MDAATWIEEYTTELKGVALSDEERELVLALAAEAAHASERAAAPLACWVAGASGAGPDDALRIARELSQRLYDDEADAII
jgi:Domain of unknown function (DUF6457)